MCVYIYIDVYRHDKNINTNIYIYNIYIYTYTCRYMQPRVYVAVHVCTRAWVIPAAFWKPRGRVVLAAVVLLIGGPRSHPSGSALVALLDMSRHSPANMRLYSDPPNGMTQRRSLSEARWRMISRLGGRGSSNFRVSVLRQVSFQRLKVSESIAFES